MWSVGIVLYAALSGMLPYDEKDVHRAEEIVQNKAELYSQPRWRDVSPEAIDLISNKFLVVQPVSRIRATVNFDFFVDCELFTCLSFSRKLCSMHGLRIFIFIEVYEKSKNEPNMILR